MLNTVDWDVFVIHYISEGEPICETSFIPNIPHKMGNDQQNISIIYKSETVFHITFYQCVIKNMKWSLCELVSLEQH